MLRVFTYVYQQSFYPHQTIEWNFHTFPSSKLSSLYRKTLSAISLNKIKQAESTRQKWGEKNLKKRVVLLLFQYRSLSVFLNTKWYSQKQQAVVYFAEKCFRSAKSEANNDISEKIRFCLVLGLSLNLFLVKYWRHK